MRHPCLSNNPVLRYCGFWTQSYIEKLHIHLHLCSVGYLVINYVIKKFTLVYFYRRAAIYLRSLWSRVFPHSGQKEAHPAQSVPLTKLAALDSGQEEAHPAQSVPLTKLAALDSGQEEAHPAQSVPMTKLAALDSGQEEAHPAQSVPLIKQPFGFRTRRSTSYSKCVTDKTAILDSMWEEKHAAGNLAVMHKKKCETGTGSSSLFGTKHFQFNASHWKADSSVVWPRKSMCGSHGCQRHGRLSNC